MKQELRKDRESDIKIVLLEFKENVAMRDAVAEEKLDDFNNGNYCLKHLGPRSSKLMWCQA